MPRTPDRFPGDREEDGVFFNPGATAPTTNGEIRYVTGQGFRVYEEGVEKGIGGGSITVKDEGTSQGTATTFNFVGSGVSASVSAGEATITISGGGGGVTETERLLGGGEPIIGSLYDTTKTGNSITQERWRRSSDSSNLKTIDYTYSSGRVSTVVVKVYDTNGSTILAQTTETYSWATNPPTSTKVRNV